MTVNRCHNIGCPRPARMFDAADPFTLFCSEDCREEEHRRLRGLGQRRGAEPQKPPTLSVTKGWTALADEASKYNSFFNQMREEQR